MKRSTILLLAVVLFAGSAVAQTGTPQQSQTSAGASSNTTVSAGQSGVKAQNDTSVSASQSASAERSGKGKNKTQTQATGSANSSQSASASAGDASIATGSTVNAVLTKSLDSRKAKEGDEVTAKTTSELKAEGQRTIPKGTKLIGHVTKAGARAKGDSESSLGILFDRAELGKGREIPVHAVVQALAAVHSTASAMNDEPMGGMNPQPASSGGYSGGGSGGVVGGAVSGVGRTVGNTAGAVGNTAGNVAGSAAGSTTGAVGSTAGSVGATTSSTLSATSQGAIGLPGYTLDAAAANATQGSVITSTGKNVKLDSGTQMVLRIVSE